MPVSAKTVDQVLKSATPKLKICFPKTSFTASGQQVSKLDSRPAPTLFLKSPSAGKAYISVSLDPDAPFPSFPILGPILHGIETGLTASGNADEDGWVELKSSGQSLVPWIPPGPPGISAPHRYIFLVWEQPEDLSNQKVLKDMGWDKGVGRASRMRWNQNDFEARFALREFVGGNWFLCG